MFSFSYQWHVLLPQLQESRCFKKRIRKLEDANKKLALELEHEKGKLAGLAQSHNALREHANILESALAKREADLVQLNLQVRKKRIASNNIDVGLVFFYYPGDTKYQITCRLN